MDTLWNAIQYDSSETNTLRNLLCKIVVDTLPERSLLSFMVISEAAVYKVVLDYIILQDIWWCLWYVLSLTKASYKAGKVEELYVLRGQTFGSNLQVLNASKIYSNEVKTSSGRSGHKRVSTTPSFTVIMSLLYLWTILDVLPSLQLSWQSLAASALWQLCSPSGNIVTVDDGGCGSMTVTNVCCCKCCIEILCKC